VRQLVQDVEHLINLGVLVLDDDLEWSEKFGEKKLSLTTTSQVSEWYLNGGRRVRSILRGNAMALVRISTEKNLSSLELTNCFDVLSDSFIVP
jgi:hypothetical protein